MKTLLNFLFITISTFSFAQIDEVKYIDFYEWTGQDGKKYTTILISNDILNSSSPRGVARVKYVSEGVTKIVEFNMIIGFERYEYNIEFIFGGDETAISIKGNSNYTPDNFLITYAYDGSYISGFQADHNELTKGEEGQLAVLYPIYIDDANHLRDLIKEFYSATDSLYRDLMKYAADFD